MPAVPWLLRALFIGAAVVGIVVPATAANAEPTASQIQEQINKSATDLEKVVEQYNKVTEENKAAKAESDQLAAELGPLLAHLGAKSDAVAQIAASAYKGHGFSATVALMSGGSPDQLIDGLNSLNVLARANQREISGYTELNQRYLDRKQQLDTILAQQAAQQQDLANQKAKIEADLGTLYDLRTKAYGTATAQSSGAHPAPPYVPGSAGVAVNYAYGALGKPYVFASAGPNGYDCSGLTMAAWGAAGVSLPHNAAMQWDAVAHISRSEMQPGDLVFYSGLGHEAIYVGNNQVIHAPQAGELVQLASVDMMPPYGYGRPG